MESERGIGRRRSRSDAADVGIGNRGQGGESHGCPRQSIFGGARYFRQVYEKIPTHVPEPDRTWFALAAYNIGYGHLEDARVLAQKAGRDPDSWQDVREFLPLLDEEYWYIANRERLRARFGNRYATSRTCAAIAICSNGCGAEHGGAGAIALN